MRASKLIALSAAAVLAGGTSVALGHSLQKGSSMEGRSSLSQHGMSSFQQGTKSSRIYGRANARELSETGTGETSEYMRMREMMRDVPRLSSVGTSLRIDAVVPRSVRQAAAPLPVEVQRMHPRLRHNRAFIYRDQFVIVNPATSRIVALIKTPS
jgi:hypothetical protein